MSNALIQFIIEVLHFSFIYMLVYIYILKPWMAVEYHTEVFHLDYKSQLFTCVCRLVLLISVCLTSSRYKEWNVFILHYVILSDSLNNSLGFQCRFV